jgi:catechol 2,3-dioxygenase-like lactoylglutathione lyase family enzyme
MKRMHVSVAVDDITESIRFYSTLFDREPSVQKSDYAKWMLDEPRVNFSISSRGSRKGVDHLGIQVDDDAELAELTARLARAGETVHRQTAAVCCYARSNKAWVRDPQGVSWETFHTFGESSAYGDDRTPEQDTAAAPEGACCTPSAPTTSTLERGPVPV